MTGGFVKCGDLGFVLIMKFYSGVQIKRVEGAERVEGWERGETMQELVWRPEGNGSLGRSRCRSKDENKSKQISWKMLV